MPDYTVSDTPPPAPRPPGQRTSRLLRNLIEVAEKHPGVPRVIVTYDDPDTARVAAAKLRSGERAVNGRPAGTWEFIHGPIKGTKKYGVWATFTPPAAPEK